MNKKHEVLNLTFDNEYIYLDVDSKNYKVRLEKISEKLTKADINEKEHYQISPSGYGIHWKLLDEDISVQGLLKQAE